MYYTSRALVPWAPPRRQRPDLQAHPHDPISRIRFLVARIRQRSSDNRFRRSDFKVAFLSAPFIFQENCRMKIEHVHFPSVFSKPRIRVSEGHFYCVYTIRFSERTKTVCFKSDLVNGSYECQNVLEKRTCSLI